MALDIGQIPEDNKKVDEPINQSEPVEGAVREELPGHSDTDIEEIPQPPTRADELDLSEGVEEFAHERRAVNSGEAQLERDLEELESLGVSASPVPTFGADPLESDVHLKTEGTAKGIDLGAKAAEERDIVDRIGLAIAEGGEELLTSGPFRLLPNVGTGLLTAGQNIYNFGIDVLDEVDALGIDQSFKANFADRPDLVFQAETTGDRIVQVATEFLAPFTGLSKVVRAGKAVSKIGNAVRYGSAGFLNDMISNGPDESAIKALAESAPELEPFLVDLMSDPDDTNMQKRFRNGLEGAGFGIFAGAIFKGVMYVATKSGLKHGIKTFAQQASKKTVEATKGAKTLAVEKGKEVAGKAAAKAKVAKTVVKDEVPEKITIKEIKDTPLGAKVDPKRIEASKDQLQKELVPDESLKELDAIRKENFDIFEPGIIEKEMRKQLDKLDDAAEVLKAKSGGKLPGEGPRPRAEVKDIAKAAGIEGNEVLRRQAAGKLNLDARNLAVNETLKKTTAESRKLIEKLSKMPKSAERDSLVLQVLSRNDEAGAIAQGLRTDIARGLEISKTLPKRIMKAARINTIHGDKDIETKMHMFMELTEENAVEYAKAVGFFGKAKEKIYKYWINSLLSGPKTMAKNLVSTYEVIGSRYVDVAAGSATGVIKGIGRGAVKGIKKGAGIKGIKKEIQEQISTAPVQVSEFKELTSGAIEGHLDGWMYFKKSFKSGVPELNDSFNILKKSQRQLDPIAFQKTDMIGKSMEVMGKAGTMPSRLLMSHGQFNGAINMRMSLRQHARREANKIIKSTPEATAAARQNFYDNFMEAPPQKFVEISEADAMEANFAARLTGVGKKTQDLIDNFRIPGTGWAPLKTLFPFFRADWNMAMYKLERSPLGILTHKVARQYRTDPAMRDVIQGRTALWLGATATLYQWAQEGLITGNGPRNPGAATALKRNFGWQPNSIIDPKTGERLTFERDTFTGWYLGIVGDLAEIGGHLESEDPETWEDVVFTTGAVLGNTFSPSFLADGMGNMASFMDPSKKGRIITQASSLAGGLIPLGNFWKSIGKISDPRRADVKATEFAGIKELAALGEMVNRIKDGLPGVGKDAILRNMFGDEVTYPLGYGFSSISPIYGSNMEDPVNLDLINLSLTTPVAHPKAKPGEAHLVLTMPARKATRGSFMGDRIEEKLSPKQYEELILMIAKPEGRPSLKEAFGAVLKNPKFKNPEMRKLRYKEVYDQYKDDGVRRFNSKNRGFTEEFNKQKRTRAKTLKTRF